MHHSHSSHLWFSQDLEHFFIIPKRIILMSGLEPIYDLQGNRKLVSYEEISSCRCSQEEAQAHLQVLWKTSLEYTKQAWLNLYTFSQKTGQEINIAELSDQFKEGLQMAGSQAQKNFG